jgi:hypothetical protein
LFIDRFLNGVSNARGEFIDHSQVFS